MKTNTSNLQENELLKLAHDFVQLTGRNVFLTGKAGTGKTTFLHRIRSLTDKRMVVVAPTGVAAINAGGVTIHSFFQLSFGPQIPERLRKNTALPGENGNQIPAGIKKFSREKLRIIRSLDLLVIDEISMVRADLLDSIDEVLRRLRRNPQPFGGVQLLIIGDLFQLSPVIKEDEWEILRPYYRSVYFFDSLAYQRAEFVHVELTHVFRQRDRDFIEILNAVRNNKVSREIFEQINRRYLPDFNPPEEDGYIILTTHNAKANGINQKKLEALASPEKKFTAVVDGDFPEFSYPSDMELKVKKGAQVMFIKNDQDAEKRFFNGKIGQVTEVTEDGILVRCPGDEEPISVTPMTWGNHKYVVNEETLEVQEEIIGTFTQVPLKLAWAITIHKSQGLTFDKVIIDAQDAFAFGQVYVALSRCRTLEGLVLKTPVMAGGILTDQNIQGYTADALNKQPDGQALEESRRKYQSMLLRELFSFRDLNYRYAALKKILLENRSVLDATEVDAYLALESTTINDLIRISDRFNAEIERFDLSNCGVESNPALQERIKKAADWFSQRIGEGLHYLMNDFVAECDNRAVRKIITEALDQLRKEISIKQQVLKETMNGFFVQDYLRARGQAMLAFREAAAKNVSHNKKQRSSSQHAELFQSLLDWREMMSREKQISVSRILSRNALLKIADELPGTMKQLLSIKGIGKVKAGLYAKDIIGKVREYCLLKNLNLSIDEVIDDGLPDEFSKMSSAECSLQLFSSGLNVAEIAARRALSMSTIEGHLAQFVAKGEIDILKLVNENKLKQISEYFLSPENTDSLAVAKDFFGEQVSYGELRFVLQYLKFLHEKK